MNILTACDVWLLARFQHFANRFQRVIGLDCFWLCRCSFALSYILMEVGVLCDTSSPVATSVAYLLLNTFGYAVAWIPLRTAIASVERQVRDGMSANPLELRARAVRQMLLCFESILTLQSAVRSDYLFLLHIISFIAVFYFASCTPLPPSKSTVRKLLEKGLAALSGALPEPALQGSDG